LGLATALVTLRQTRPALAPIVEAYVGLFRGVPALLGVYFLSFAVPLLIPEATRVPLLFDNPLTRALQQAFNLHPYYFGALVTALSFNTSAYLVEILRGALEGVGDGQTEAGLATGLSRRDLLWDVLLPQAALASLPAILTRLIHNLKNTSLAVFVPVPDLFSGIQTAASRTFRAPELLVAGALLYLALAAGASAAASLLERRVPRWRVGPAARVEWQP
jgi:ABC-type amino acid transport system permease subunit